MNNFCTILQMTKSTWLSSDRGIENVKKLLRRAGLPLESMVARHCREFCKRHDGERPRISTIRAIYNDSSWNRAAREVDQSVQLDGYIDLPGKLGVRLRLRIPIECKQRQDISVFGFPRPRKERNASLPLVSDFAGAMLVNQLAYKEPSVMASTRECAITLLNTEKSQVHEEQLLQNAGASLYDFIRTVEKRPGRFKPDELVIKSGLLSRFHDFTAPSFDWFARFRAFLREVTASEFESFNHQWRNGEKYYIEVSIHVPVICVDAPLFVVPFSSTGEPRRFLPAHCLLTGLRLARWPGKMRFDLGRRTPETLIIIADATGLENILASCLAWYHEMTNELIATGEVTIQRALLEGALYRSTAAITELRRRHAQ